MAHDPVEIRYARNGDLHIAYEDPWSERRRRPGPDPGPSSRSSSSFAGCLPWASFTRGLAEIGRLFTFDHRGTGLSDRVRGYRLPAIEERVDDLRSVLDAAGSERSVLVALADGGPLGCMFAAAHPERTVALVLCNTRPRVAWAPDYPWGMREDEFERASVDMDRSWGTRKRAEEAVRRSALEGLSFEEAVEWHLGNMRLSAGPGDAVAAFRMFYESDVRHVLGTIRVPSLVLSRGGEQADEGAASRV